MQYLQSNGIEKTTKHIANKIKKERRSKENGQRFEDLMYGGAPGGGVQQLQELKDKLIEGGGEGDVLMLEGP